MGLWADIKEALFEPPPSTKVGMQEPYTVVVIDGCEYIQVSRFTGLIGYYAITHKGNCARPIHRRGNAQR